MGTPALAAHILERLVAASGASFRVTGVVTRPDRPRGRSLLERAIRIAADDKQGTLKERLAELGASALLGAIDLAIRGELVETPQEESLATHTAMIKKQDAVIDWTVSAAQIERMTRAYDPWPVARTRLGGGAMVF